VYEDYHLINTLRKHCGHLPHDTFPRHGKWILITVGKWKNNGEWGSGRSAAGHPRFEEYALDALEVIDPNFDPDIILVQINHGDQPAHQMSNFVVDARTMEVRRYPDDLVDTETAQIIKELLAKHL